MTRSQRQLALRQTPRTHGRLQSQRRALLLREFNVQRFATVDAMVSAEASPVALVLASLSYEVLYCNRAFRQIFDEQSWTAQPGADLLALCGPLLDKDFLDHLVRTGVARQGVMRRSAARGEGVWWCNGVRVTGEANTPKWLLLTFTTLSEPALAGAGMGAIERAVIEAERLDRFGTWMMTVEATQPALRTSMHRSRGMSSLLGAEHSVQVVPLRQWLDAIHRDDRGAISAALQRLATQGGEYLLDYRLASDPARILRSHGRALPTEPGAAVSISGIERDVSESAEHARSEREQLYLQRALSESYECPAFAVDTRLRLRWFNSLFAALVRELTASDPDVGMGLEQIFRRREQRRRILDNLRRSLRGERRVEELSVSRNLHDQRYYDLVYAPIKDDGGAVIGAAVTGSDVTAKRLLEDRAARSARARRDPESERS